MKKITENNNIVDTIEGYDIEVSSISSTSYAFFNSTTRSNDVTMENLQHYIRYPMIYNAILREISKQCYSSNGMYAKAIDARVALPLLSFVSIIPKGKINDANKRRKNKINLMMRLINHEKTSRDILRKLDIYGMYVGILRDTIASNKNIQPTVGMIESIDRIEGLSLDDNFMIQPLDLDYCKIVGLQNNVSIAAFDMTYFDQFRHGGLVNEIKNFPKEFIKAYNNYRRDASKRWFILDYRKTIALTARSDIDEAYGRPYGLTAFADMKLQSDYTDSQYKLINELASSIYYLVLPEGERKGLCALNKEQQDNVIAAFKNAVKINTSGDRAKISTLSLPPNTQINRLSKDASLLKDTMSDEIIKKISTNLSFASTALNAASEGSSGFAGLQINIDIISSQIFQMLNQIAVEYTRVLNEHLKIKPSDYIEINYLPLSYLNKDNFYDKMKDLYLTAGGSRTFMIAASGISPSSYFSVCDEERYDDMDNLYPPHITSYTATDSADKSNPEDNLGGRPKKDERDLDFKGAITRGTGANDVIKPSTK